MPDEQNIEETADTDETVEDVEAQEVLAEAVAETETADEPDDDDPDEDAFDADRARRKIRKANAEARRQRERAKAAEDRAAGLEPAQRDAALQRVARRLRLPDNEDSDYFLSRLQGDDVESLSADAERLLTLMAPKQPRMPAPNPSQGADTTPPRDPTPAEKASLKEAEGDWNGALQLKSDMLLNLRDATK